LRLSLLCLSMLALSLLGVSRAAQAMRPADPPELVRTMRASADHYRTVAWTYQHAAKVHTTPSSFAYRRSADPAFLQWTVARWRQHERTARLTALHALKRRLDLSALARVRRLGEAAAVRLGDTGGAGDARRRPPHDPLVPGRPALADGRVLLHPPLRGVLEREQRQRLLRRAPDGLRLHAAVRHGVPPPVGHGRPVAGVGPDRGLGPGLPVGPRLLALAEYRPSMWTFVDS